MEEKECQLIRPAVLTAGTFFNRDFLYFNDCSLCPKMGEFSSGPRQGSPESSIGTYGAESKPEHLPLGSLGPCPPLPGPLLRQRPGELSDIHGGLCHHHLWGPRCVPGTVCRALQTLSSNLCKISVSAKCYPHHVLKNGNLEQIRKLRLTAMK